MVEGLQAAFKASRTSGYGFPPLIASCATLPGFRFEVGSSRYGTVSLLGILVAMRSTAEVKYF